MLESNLGNGRRPRTAGKLRKLIESRCRPKAYRASFFLPSLQINVLATWYLVQLILPTVTKTASTYYSPGARRGSKTLVKPHISIVSSGLHHIASFKDAKQDNILGSMNKEPKSFGAAMRYMDTKVMEVYLVREFLKRHGSEVDGIVLNTSNPGWCHSAVSIQAKLFSFASSRRLIQRHFRP